jgi:hypothetical protein
MQRQNPALGKTVALTTSSMGEPIAVEGAMRRIFAVLIALTISACANTPRVDYADMPSGIYPSDADESALQDAQIMFGLKGQRPASLQERAKGFAALEYISGALQVHPRWLGLSDTSKMQLMQARLAARDVIGVAPTAKSQSVVNALLAVSRAKDDSAVVTALNDSIFSLGGTATRERLANLPPLQAIGTELARASEEVTGINNRASTGGY